MRIGDILQLMATLPRDKGAAAEGHSPPVSEEKDETARPWGGDRDLDLTVQQLQKKRCAVAPPRASPAWTSPAVNDTFTAPPAPASWAKALPP